MILRHFHIFAHSSAHTPRMSAGFALLFALLLGTLPLNARLVLRHGDQVLSPADTVRITVVEQRTEYPSDDPASATSSPPAATTKRATRASPPRNPACPSSWKAILKPTATAMPWRA